jgi:hypothetical protein
MACCSQQGLSTWTNKAGQTYYPDLLVEEIKKIGESVGGPEGKKLIAELAKLGYNGDELVATTPPPEPEEGS